MIATGGNAFDVFQGEGAELLHLGQALPPQGTWDRASMSRPPSSPPDGLNPQQTSSDFSIHRIIQIMCVVRFADCAAHRQYLALVVEDVRHDTHDHIRRPEEPRLAWIANHLAR